MKLIFSFRIQDLQSFQKPKIYYVSCFLENFSQSHIQVYQIYNFEYFCLAKKGRQKSKNYCFFLDIFVCFLNSPNVTHSHQNKTPEGSTLQNE